MQGPTGTYPRPSRPNNRGFYALRRFFQRLPIPSLGPWGTLIGLGGLFVGTLAIGLVVAVTLRAARSADAFNPFRDNGESIPLALPNATPNPTFLAPTLPAWQGTDRVTVLVLGSDSRPAERGNTRPRTDSIMLLSLDPTTQHASVLSIPRDLYVDIPGYGLNRINTAYVFGGGQLAVDTIQYNLGVRVDYYVLVEFDAFITLIDEIGGIDINVPYEIYDPEYPDMNYGYDPLYIPAGFQHMDGELALKYARTRHGDNDFERARRQQAVLFAIRDKIISLNMLPTLIQKAPTLYATLSNSIQTNMTLEQMISLALAAQSVPRENIRSGVIDANYTVGYYTPQGASVLIPNRANIGSLLTYVFWLQ